MRIGMGPFVILTMLVGCSSPSFLLRTPPPQRPATVSSGDAAGETKPSESYQSDPEKPSPQAEASTETPPETAAVPAPIVSPQPEASTETPPDIAVVPVPIGGAPLTCIRSTDASAVVRCDMKMESGAPVSSNPNMVYIVSGEDPVQTKVAITPAATGSFTFTIPTQLQSLKAFAVAVGFTDNAYSGSNSFKYAGKDVLMAMVGYGKADLTNVVKDPGFEEFVVPAKDSSLYIEQGDFKNWMARSKADTGCLDLSPMIEIQKNYGTAAAFEGKQWTALDSVCAEDHAKAAGNIGLFQDLVVKKDHIYAISFAQKRRPGVSSLQKIVVSWGSEVLVQRETVDTQWTVLSIIKAATTDQMRIDFEEVGLSDGYGTLLDDVRVYDLGLPDLL